MSFSQICDFLALLAFEGDLSGGGFNFVSSFGAVLLLWCKPIYVCVVGHVWGQHQPPKHVEDVSEDE